MVGVTRSTEGGYTSAEGWSPESKARVQVMPATKTASEGDSSNPETFRSYRQTLSAHTWRVMQELEILLSSHKLDEPQAAALRLAAARHDWGKAHEVFQRTLHKHDDSTELLAKQVWSPRRP